MGIRDESHTPDPLKCRHLWLPLVAGVLSLSGLVSGPSNAPESLT